MPALTGTSTPSPTRAGTNSTNGSPNLAAPPRPRRGDVGVIHAVENRRSVLLQEMRDLTALRASLTDSTNDTLVTESADRGLRGGSQTQGDHQRPSRPSTRSSRLAQVSAMREWRHERSLLHQGRADGR